MNEEQLDKLIQSLGGREKPDDLIHRRAFNAVHAHWQQTLANKKKQKFNRIIPMAASLFAVVGIVFFMNAAINRDANNPIFTQPYVQGELLLSADGLNWENHNAESLSQARWLKTTADSYVNVRLSDNSQLRINQNTVIQAISPLEISLKSGEIYIDADQSVANSQLLVSTVYGVVKHIGTRYLVKQDDDNLIVAVRNGQVEINNDKLKQHLDAGHQFKLNGDETHIQAIAKEDNLWQWTMIAAEPFITGGKTLHDFIAWYAHEYGYKINWNGKESSTQRVTLSGEPTHLSQSQQIKAVFASTKFDYAINGGILSVL